MKRKYASTYSGNLLMGPSGSSKVRKYSHASSRASRSGYSSVPRAIPYINRAERKYYTQVIGTTLSATSDWTGGELDPATSCLNAPDQGDGYNQRIGRKISIHSIRIKGSITTSAQADAAALRDQCYVRMALVLDTQTNAAQMSSESLFDGATTGSNALGILNSPANANNFGRFKILKEKVFALPYPFSQSDRTVPDSFDICATQKPIKFTHIFKKPLVVRFNNVTSASVSAIVDNSLHLIGLATNTTGTPIVRASARICFTDQ